MIVPVGYTGFAIVAALIVSKLAAMGIEGRWPRQKPETLPAAELLSGQ